MGCVCICRAPSFPSSSLLFLSHRHMAQRQWKFFWVSERFSSKTESMSASERKKYYFLCIFSAARKRLLCIKILIQTSKKWQKKKKRADKISGKTVWVFSWARSGIMRDAVREESKRAFFWFGGFGFLFDWIWWCLFIIFGWRCGLGVDQEKYTQMIYGWR